MGALALIWSAAEIDELLAFLAAWLGPIGASPAYAARLVAYFRNNFDRMFAAELIGQRVHVELTPRGQAMIERLPPFEV